MSVLSVQGGEIVGNVVAIPLVEIHVGERMRAVDPEWAEGMARIMARDGQQTPIEVCRLEQGGFALVTGGHRLAAANLNGWYSINAIVVSSDWADRRLREVSENLFRRDLDPIDRAAFIAELVDLSRAKSGVGDQSPQQIAANARWQKLVQTEALNASLIMRDAYGWTKQVSERVGLSMQTVERDLMLHRRLSPQVKALLAGHPAYRNGSALRSLAKLEAEQQLQVAEMLASGAIKGVGEGVATLQQKPKASAEEKRFSTVMSTIGRMGKAERQQLFDHLGGQFMNELIRAITKAQMIADGDEA